LASASQRRARRGMDPLWAPAGPLADDAELLRGLAIPLGPVEEAEREAGEEAPVNVRSHLEAGIGVLNDSADHFADLNSQRVTQPGRPLVVEGDGVGELRLSRLVEGDKQQLGARRDAESLQHLCSRNLPSLAGLVPREPSLRLVVPLFLSSTIGIQAREETLRQPGSVPLGKLEDFGFKLLSGRRPLQVRSPESYLLMPSTRHDSMGPTGRWARWIPGRAPQQGSHRGP